MSEIDALREALFRTGYITACNDLIQTLPAMVAEAQSLEVAKAVERISDAAIARMKNPPTIIEVRDAHARKEAGL